MTTYADVFDRAYDRSSKSRPSDVDENKELLGVAYRALCKAFSAAAKVDPSFFGEVSAAVPFDAGGWARPAAAELVFRIETADGQEVVTTPLNDRRRQDGMPAVYELARGYRPAGGQDDPGPTAELVFWYSRFPDRPVAPVDAVGPLWVEQFDPLLEIPVAIHMAMKDSAERRAQEVATLEREYNGWMALFQSHIENRTRT